MVKGKLPSNMLVGDNKVENIEKMDMNVELANLK